jgi:hypothetical protein
MKMLIEWKELDQAWRQVKLDVGVSRNGNYWFKHNSVVYVFPDMKIDSKWVPAGRIARGCVFIGKAGEETYGEHNTRMFAGMTKWEKPVMA